MRESAEGQAVPFHVSSSVAIGTVLQPLNSSMIGIAIVAMAIHFGPSAALAWVIPGLYISTAVTAPTAGRLGVILGPRRVYLAGLALVATGSIIGVFAPTTSYLVAAYVLIGLGTATQFPNAMTMIRNYADARKLNPQGAITILAICAQATAALGPTLGGLLIGTLGWQSILWFNLPAVLISGFLVIRFGEATPVVTPAAGTAELRRFDFLGIMLFLAFVTTTMLFLLSLRGQPVWWLIPGCVLLLAVFVKQELRVDEPFLDLRTMHHNHALRATLARTLLTYTAFYCIYFGVPQWLQYSRGMSATEAGLTMLPVAAVGMLATIAASWMYRRFGVRSTLIVGTGALLVGGILLAVVEDSTAPLLVLLLVAAVLGIPSGFNNIANQNLVNASTSAQEVGTAMGMYRTTMYMGANLSAVALQLFAGSLIDDEGLHRTGWFIAVVGGLLLIEVLVRRSLDRTAS